MHVKLPKNHETGRQRDLALITMDSPESVDRAVANASFVIMGKRVKQICVCICGRWIEDLMCREQRIREVRRMEVNKEDINIYFFYFIISLFLWIKQFYINNDDRLLDFLLTK